MPRLLLCVALIAAACSGATSGSSLSHPPSHAASATPTLPVAFDDMMGGGVPAATVFVLSGREVLAVALLNHFIRYRIPVGDNAQLAVSSDGARLYVADEVPHPNAAASRRPGASARDGAAAALEPEVGGELRLRWFDVGSGAERASRTFEIDAQTAGRLPRSGSARAAMAFGLGGQLVLMRQQTLPWVSGVVVHAHDAWSLRDLGAFFKKQGCAERLVASSARIAVVCLADPEFAISAPAAPYLPLERAKGALAGVAMAEDGAIVGAYPDGALVRIRAGARELERFADLSAGRGTVVRDGVAFVQAKDERWIVARGGEPPSVHVLGAIAGEHRASFPLRSVPGSGILAFGQFAYWVDAAGEGVFHVDLASGLVEKMTSLPGGATLGALAPR